MEHNITVNLHKIHSSILLQMIDSIVTTICLPKLVLYIFHWPVFLGFQAWAMLKTILCFKDKILLIDILTQVCSKQWNN